MDEPQSGCWKVGENGEAFYIDVECAGPVSASHEYSWWSELPDLVLEKVFTLLDVRTRYYASLVCRDWNRAFHMPRVWRKFLVEDNTLTRAKYNYYSGWQHALDHLRTQLCLTHVGRYFHELNFMPKHSFHNLYQMMTLISWHAEQARGVSGALKPTKDRELRGIGCNVNTVSYVFPCNMSNQDDNTGNDVVNNGGDVERVFGTGGQLLAALKRLLRALPPLRELRLVDLLLDHHEASRLLDDVCEDSQSTLKKLILVNASRNICPLLHVGVLLNLQCLVISPQSLSDDVIALLGSLRHLRALHIHQTRYTTPTILLSTPSVKAWRDCHRDNPMLSVGLHCDREPVLWQEGAPVTSVVIADARTMMDGGSVLSAAGLYSPTLKRYALEGLHHDPKRQLIADAKKRNKNDELLLLLVTQCDKLETLMIRDCISCATLVRCVRLSRGLSRLHVLRSALRPQETIKEAETRISAVLGYRWRALTDQEYAAISTSIT